MAAEPSSELDASHRAHQHVQFVLRCGLVVSVVLILAGLIASLASGGDSTSVVHLGRLLSDATLPDRIVAVGLTVLAITPLVRVVALVVIWTSQRDRRFVAMSLIVTAILAIAIISGLLSSE